MKKNQLNLALIAMIVVVSVAGFGCEPKVASPFNGKQSTAAEIENQRAAAVQKAKDEAEKTLRDQEAVLKRQKAEYDRQAAAIQSGFERAGFALKADTESSLAELDAKFDAVSESVKNAVADSVARAKTSVTWANASADEAFTAIEKQQQALSSLGSVVSAVAGTAGAAGVPGAGLLATLVTGVAGLAIGGGVQTARKNSRLKRAQEENTSLEVAKQQAEAEAAERAAVADRLDKAIKSIVNALDVARMKDPAIAEGMKRLKGEMLDKMTDTAVAMVKSETLT